MAGKATGTGSEARRILGSGLMSRLICEFDWAKTCLGPLEAWPASMLSAVNMLLLSPAPMAILWGEEGLTIYNDASVPFAGNRHPGLLGTPCEKAWPEGVDFIRQMISKCLQGETYTSTKLAYQVTRNNHPEEIFMDLYASPVPGDNGEWAGVLVVNVETTAYVKTENALKESEERLRLVIDGSNDGIWDFDLETKAVFWNDRLFQLFGFTRDEVPNPGIEFLLPRIHPDDKELMQNAFAKVTTYGSMYDINYRVQHKQGHYVHIHVKGKPVFDKNGQIKRIAGTTTDITERKRVEAALTESEERFSSIINQAAVGIAEVDLTGKFVLVNDRYCEMLGRPREALLQMRMQDISHADDVPGNMALFQQAIQEGISFRIEKRYIRPDNSEIWVSNDVATVKDAAGKPAYLVAISVDITERKLAELHEKLFLAMCENSSDFIGIATLEGQPYYVNPAGRQLVGLDNLQEVRQTKLMDYFLDEDKPFVQNVIVPTQWEQGKWVGEYRFRHFKTGATIPVHYSQFLVKDPITGELLGVASVTQNITARKQVEDALKESEERFRNMAEAAGILIAQTDEEGNAIYFNREWLELTGRTPEELIQYGWADFFHPDDRAGFVQAYQEAFAQKITLKREFRLRTKTGDYSWQLAQVTPRINQSGNFVGYISSCIDITELKQTEQALTESEDRFRTFANNIQNLAWMAMPDGWIFWYNQRWYDYTGSNFEEMQGWGWEHVHHPDHIERVVTFVKEAWNKGETWELIFPLKSAQGEYRWFLTRAYAVKDAAGQVIRWIGTNTDIHEQKVAEENLEAKNQELQKTNNDLDNFIYTASHDLKAPITNIEGLVDALVEDLPPQSWEAPGVETIVQLIRNAIGRFRNTLSDLTELTKLQRNTADDVGHVAFPVILSEICLDLQAAIRQAEAKITEDFSACPSIQFSRKNLRSIIYNLISNAIKYRHSQRLPVIQVSTSLEGNFCVLTVQDNGLGMDLTQDTRIFSMFRRLHDHVEGSGLGLYIVKKIIDNSGGHITVTSTPGQGSTFKVYFKIK